MKKSYLHRAPFAAFLLFLSLFFLSLQECAAQVAWQKPKYELVTADSTVFELGTAYTCPSFKASNADACTDTFRILHIRTINGVATAWGDTITVEGCTGYNPPCHSGMIYGDAIIWLGNCTKIHCYAWRQK